MRSTRILDSGLVAMEGLTEQVRSFWVESTRMPLHARREGESRKPRRNVRGWTREAPTEAPSVQSSSGPTTPLNLVRFALRRTVGVRQASAVSVFGRRPS